MTNQKNKVILEKFGRKYQGGFGVITQKNFIKLKGKF